MARLITISNRVAVPGPRSAPGGLAVGLLAALRGSGGIWFGWDGSTRAETCREPRQQTGEGVTFVTTSLSKRDYQSYYAGFSNGVLWPLFHERLDQVEFQRHYYQGYQRVNALFADQLRPLVRPDDLIWVHDYHCLLLADELRGRGVSNPLGFFLHIPFPPFDIYRALPHHKAIVEKLCRYDLIGFQTDLDRGCFLDCVRRLLPGARVSRHQVLIDGRRCRTGVFPIGIDTDNVTALAAQGRQSIAGRRLRESLDGRRLIIGVDRLDYSKGLAERFRAFQRLLEQYPETRSETVLLQVAQPSRSDVPAYKALRRELDYLAGQINGRYAEYDRIPLRYLNRGFARPTILGFLALSHVGLITPLRDGMNLVAKEYVAAQNPQDPGVLVLSYLAGAAEELDGALLVNPYHIDDVARTVLIALKMPLSKRRARWEKLMASLHNNPIEGWARRYTRALAATGRSAPGH